MAASYQGGHGSTLSQLDEQSGGDVVGQVGDDAARAAPKRGRGSKVSASAGDDVETAGIMFGDLLQSGDCALVAFDRDHAGGAERQQCAREAARTGADSNTVTPASAPAARAMRAARLRSSRKFWPSDFLATRPCRRMTSRNGGRPSGVNHSRRGVRVEPDSPPWQAAPPAAAPRSGLSRRRGRCPAMSKAVP
jgi:hypothetical protein